MTAQEGQDRGLALQHCPEIIAHFLNPWLSWLVQVLAGFILGQSEMGPQAGRLWLQVMPKTAQIVVEGVNLRVRFPFGRPPPPSPTHICN